MNMNEKIKTKADRIRAMTDEEIANFVATYITCDFCFLDWLRSLAESEGET